ncbi:DUF1707 domain-containing protein [Nocardioides oleivorans]|uniref:DUF1707 domain-containing protein n=1 Tax=Nocardioides oleivorans TaxID=273676 RepID=A0A4Q2RP02_9ACTN|nr:DUF1707 domain-containing protein [Nocardioides oleivorans]RYB90547.1 DUF1707 domain-containing protein [Nocardioides oleivorans]
MSSSDVWARFEHDPRSPQAARLRASDKDRDVAFEALGEAFAEGRLDHEEYDERLTAVSTAKVLGDVVPQLQDLVPDAPTGALARRAGGSVVRPDVHEQAVAKWRSDRREAVTGFIGLSVLLWTIWAVTMLGGFPWPLFPTGFALMNLVRTVVQKQDIIEAHEKRLLKREKKALDLERQKQKELESGSD